MTELIYDIEDCCPADYAVMSVLSIKGKALSKSAIMRECIERYGDLIEHGPYLYGEYSDDIATSFARTESARIHVEDIEVWSSEVEYKGIDTEGDL